MEVKFTSKHLELRKYRAKVVSLGPLKSEQNELKRKLGVYAYVEILDLDTDKTEMLTSVAVYLGCAPFIKEGQEIEFFYGFSQDEQSVNAILAVRRGADFSDDYKYFLNEVEVGVGILNTLLKVTLFPTVGLFLLGVPLMLWIIPGLVCWGVGIGVLFLRRKLKKSIAEIRRAIPDHETFKRLLA